MISLDEETFKESLIQTDGVCSSKFVHMRIFVCLCISIYVNI